MASYAYPMSLLTSKQHLMTYQKPWSSSVYSLPTYSTAYLAVVKLFIEETSRKLCVTEHEDHKRRGGSPSTGFAAIAKTVFYQNIQYSLNIPDTTVTSGVGDIYFQLSAPTLYQWVALGQGSSMSGSNIFIMYTSADGTNVTVSPRLGVGNQQPQQDTTAQIAVLEGSGVHNGVMTANVRCSNCDTWQGGSMEFTGSSSSNWIYAYRTGSAINSDDIWANLVQHNHAGSFNWDLSQARGGADVNPFLSSATNTTATSSAPASPGRSSSDSQGSSSAEDATDSSRSQEQQERMQTAHAVCAAVAFVGLFPIGAILIRVASFDGLVWVHVGIQAFALLLFIAAVGLGLSMAVSGNQLNQAHPIIGLVLFALLMIQPVLGWMHHVLYKKYQGRTLWSHAHLTVGRIAIPLGIINGGLGLQLSSADRSAKIAYGVVAGVVGVTYFAAIASGEVKRKRTVDGAAQSEKDHARSDWESSGSTGV
ncbi:hypothetical protein LTR49_026095 [Elasticomyces elasticus]|nr:hypothetical protein LTR49_026095 [Elasticomyces elasticus]